MIIADEDARAINEDALKEIAKEKYHLAVINRVDEISLYRIL